MKGGNMTITFISDRKPLTIPDSVVEKFEVDRNFLVVRKLAGIPDLWINLDQILMFEE
jgi:hypothetical protein